jgi:creatinine amidohydrolase
MYNRKAKMNKTYLKDFENYDVAYIPVGTLEWHGNHLPIEIDSITAQKLCEIANNKRPGFVLPPLYLGTDRAENGLRGMERYLGKSLPGEIYYIKPELLSEILTSLINNLSKFDKIYIFTGHAGSKQIEVLKDVAGKNNKVTFVDHEAGIEFDSAHANEYELSLFWAFFPEEEAKCRQLNIPNDDDYFQWLGYDPRTKASLEIGNKFLKAITNNIEQAVTDN